MCATEANDILTQTYETIFHDVPATWIRTHSAAEPDIVYPISHLPPFLYNLIAFHFEGRDNVWYINKYTNLDGTPMTWSTRYHLPKAKILTTYDKYLNSISHLWNEAYCQVGLAAQERLVCLRINKYLEKSGYDLSPLDPYKVGIWIPKFREETCYVVFYASEDTSSAYFLVEEILSAPHKADISRFEHDLSTLPKADATLIKDILAQLGTEEAQGEGSESEEEAAERPPR